MNFKSNILIFFIILICIGNLNAQSMEYAVKASFIEKFARFTEWNKKIPDNYFKIGILGQSPFNGELERMAQIVKIKNKPVKIYYFADYNDAIECQILYVSSSEKNKLLQIVEFSVKHNILTISDTPGFCKKGIHINFYINENKQIKYELNHVSIKQANLLIDMKLLQFAKIVN